MQVPRSNSDVLINNIISQILCNLACVYATPNKVFDSDSIYLLGSITKGLTKPCTTKKSCMDS